MIKPENMETGSSYTCSFVIESIPMDEYGRPGGMLSLADVPISKIGNYKSTGTIVSRDSSSELLEVLDDRNGKKKWVVPFNNVTGIMPSWMNF